eukprot:gene3853-7013_t
MSTTKLGWSPKLRDYSEEKNDQKNPERNVKTHPLSEEQEVEYDPLRARSSYGFSFLGKAAKKTEEQEEQKSSSTILNWNSKTSDYLKKYTTDKNIPVISSIVEGPDDHTRVIKLEDRAKMRLEQLNKTDTDKEYKSQKKYIQELENLNVECADCWNSNNRVKALKIVIKCTKLLGNNDVPQFYPSLFVLVSQVLDTFGSLVFERIKDLSTIKDEQSGKVEHKLGNTFKVSEVTDAARETCLNWFYKIASIRELMPRIYVELCLLPCQLFLTDDKKQIKSIIERLTKSVRGIGEPMISMYARLYLARKAVELLPNEPSFVMTMMQDFFVLLKEWKTDEEWKIRLEKYGLTLNEYIDLYAPTIEWILEAIGQTNEGNEKLFNNLIEKYQKDLKTPMFLYHVLNSFDSRIVSKNAGLMVFLIRESEDVFVEKHKFYKALGEKFNKVPPKDSEKMRLLNEIWKNVTKIDNVINYIPIVETFMDYVSKNFTMREVGILFSDLRKHLKGFQDYGAIENSLQNLLLVLLSNTNDFVKVFNMPHFLFIFDLLKSNTKVKVSQAMLNSFGRKKFTAGEVVEPIVLNSLFDLSKTLHDSLNYLSDETQINKISNSICTFINNIPFGTKFDQELKFLTDCRNAFPNLDQPKEILIWKTFTMIQQTFTLMNGKHSKQTFTFTKSCFAFIHITIPSIDDIIRRLKFFFLSGQLALMNNLLPQADTLLKAAIETIRDVPSTITLPNNTMIETESDLVEFILSFTSCLVGAPGNPEYGPFYLFKGLLTVIQNYKWSPGSDSKIKLLTNSLSCLACFYQTELPYAYLCGGNDTLYMEDDSFHEDCLKIGNNVLDLILKELEILSQDSDVSTVRKHSNACLDLVNSFISNAAMTPKLKELTNDLMKKAKKSNEHSKYLENTLKVL